MFVMVFPVINGHVMTRRLICPAFPHFLNNNPFFIMSYGTSLSALRLNLLEVLFHTTCMDASCSQVDIDQILVAERDDGQQHQFNFLLLCIIIILLKGTTSIVAATVHEFIILFQFIVENFNSVMSFIHF